MKKFFYIGGVLMFIALAATFYVWWLLQAATETGDLNPVDNDLQSQYDSGGEADQSSGATTVEQKEVQSNLSGSVLSPAQQKTAETFGIDTSEVSITPAMINCAKSKLTPDRVEALINGEAPTFTETLTLLPCLTAE